MPKLTIIYGVALIILGLLGYFGGQAALPPGEIVSKTALIPAAFGLVALILGAVALKPGARKHAMHGAAVVSLLAFLAPLSRVFKAVSAGTFDAFKPSTASMLTMAALSLLFLILCVRSFIAARRARLAPQ